MTPPPWAEDFITLLDDCEERESRLTDWERTFIDSLRQRIQLGYMPSEKQSDTLDEIWERATEHG